MMPIRLTYARNNQGGFTLPELLVALAIFISVMAGVSLLFIGSVRTMRQGFQTQEAFEQARSTLKVIERDLTRAFTSREFGEYYTFYGTPIGMSFVGLVSPRDSAVPNLARVTYVIYHDPEQQVDFSLASTVDQTIETDLRTTDDVYKRTYRLLRYIEPNVNTLDDFPVDWNNIALLDSDFSSVAQSLRDLLDDACNCDSQDVIALNNDPVQLARVRAKKREVWIRLLAGGDLIVPNGWQIAINNPARLGIGVPGLIPDPDDYVVTENILHTFDYHIPGETLPNGTPLIREYDIFSPPMILFPAEGAAFDQPPIFQYDLTELPNNPDTFTGLLPSTFFTYRDFQHRPRLDQNGDPIIIGGRPAFDIVPVVTRYWNDNRNLDQNMPGSPLRPRLPQEITTHFTFFFPSPYAGSPDFRRTFDQRINIPSGYKRQPQP